LLVKHIILLNKRVDNNKKTQEASNFKKGRRIANVHVNKLRNQNPCADHSSNVLIVLDKCLSK